VSAETWGWPLAGFVVGFVLSGGHFVFLMDGKDRLLALAVTTAGGLLVAGLMVAVAVTE
jgi:hypothetical protein